MVTAFDNNVLCLLLHPEASIPVDPKTGKAVSRAEDRLSHFVEQLRGSDSRILIPTPVLAEFLTFASTEYLTEINSSAHFEIAPFGQRAAIETALAMRKAISGPGKKMGLGGTWQKIKLDWQIGAIAKVGGAKTLYTTDSDLGTIAGAFGITALHVCDLELPPATTPLLEGLEVSEAPEPLLSSALPPSSQSDEAEQE